MNSTDGTPRVIDKSTRHPHIIGNFGEHLMCNWLSCSGFEVGIVDHTGLDVIAYQPSTKKRLGITVKSRTRTQNPHDAVNVFEKDDRKKLLDACIAFSCEPWIGIYVETKDGGDVYLTSVRNYESKYLVPENKVGDWKMTCRAKQEYDKDPDVMHIAIRFDVQHWFAQSAAS